MSVEMRRYRELYDDFGVSMLFSQDRPNSDVYSKNTRMRKRGVFRDTHKAQDQSLKHIWEMESFLSAQGGGKEQSS